MADPVDFDPYLGWVDVVDPDNIPEDARLITAADLLRYENHAVAATDAINQLSTDTSDEALAALAANPASDLNQAITGIAVTGILAVSMEYGAGSAEVLMAPTIESPATVVKAGTTEIAYTVPPSGAVQVDLEAWLITTASASLEWSLNTAHNGTTVATRKIREGSGTGRAHLTVRLAGDTPGEARTLRWYHQNASSSLGSHILSDATAGKFLSMMVTPLA